MWLFLRLAELEAVTAWLEMPQEKCSAPVLSEPPRCLMHTHDQIPMKLLKTDMPEHLTVRQHLWRRRPSALVDLTALA